MFQGKCNENRKPKTSVPNDKQLIRYIPFQTKTAQHWFFPKQKGMFLRQRTIAYLIIGFWVERGNQFCKGLSRNFFMDETKPEELFKIVGGKKN
jgi:hypothetical protein